MIAILAATLLTYSFPVGKPVQYDVTVQFNGYVQVFGGRDADVEVKMLVEADGIAPDSEDNPQVVSEIKDLSLAMNGSALPIGPENVTRYFPKTTISLTPEGRMLKTDAPDVKLPVRLPALHPKRFPDITYLPIEFPAAGVEEGKPFSFAKQFGESKVDFTVTPTSISEASVEMKIEMKQAFSQLEDKYGNPVEKDGAVEVSTIVTGDGTATFDRSRGIVSKLNVVANARSTAKELASGKESERMLKTTLSVVAKEPR